MVYKKQHLKILSIKIEASFLSAAVFENYDLLCWKSKKINEEKISACKRLKNLRKILEELIEFWNPDLIAAEDIYFAQSKKSKILASFVEEIKNISREKKLKLFFYSPLSVREYICEEETTKMNAARIVAEEYYPWLVKKYEKEEKKKWYQAKTGLRIFDAVALGLYCLYKLKLKNK